MFRSLRWSIFLLGAVGVLAALMMAIQGFMLQGRMNENATQVFVAKDVVADILPPPMYLIELRLILSQGIEGSIDGAEAKKQFERVVSDYGQRVEYWTKNPPFGLESKLLGRQHEAAQKFIASARTQVIEPLQAGDAASARNSLAQVNRLYLEHRAGVNDSVVASSQFAEKAIAEFEKARAWSGRIALGVTVAAVALVLLLYKLVLRSIQEPLQRCSQLARRIAEGELTQRDGSADKRDEKRDDSIGELQAALSQMRLNLSSIVSGVRQSAESVASASTQITQGNSDLSSRTDQQASALEQTTAAMEELNATSRHNADNAQRASQLAQGASLVAVAGGEVVGRVVQTMKSIDASSKKIADIINVIDGIAFQTNILALNAAVEAARAGEQGRGFAVVAAEVRSLAGRSATAAKEIKELISASVESVQQGTDLVDQAGVKMTEVVGAIKRVSDIMAQISTASAEQCAGVRQVGEAIAHMEQGTQQNAALVEQSAAASESLKGQSQELVRAVAVFKLGHPGAMGHTGGAGHAAV